MTRESTATATRVKTKKSAVQSFMRRQTPDVRGLLEQVLRGYRAVVSPSLSYCRIATTDGQVLGYAIPSRSHVRLDLPKDVDGAPQKLRAAVERGGHDRRKIEVRSDEDVSPARELLAWIESQAVPAST